MNQMETYKKPVYVAALCVQVHLLTSTLMMSQSGFNALTPFLIDSDKKISEWSFDLFTVCTNWHKYIMYKSKGKYTESGMTHTGLMTKMKLYWLFPPKMENLQILYLSLVYFVPTWWPCLSLLPFYGTTFTVLYFRISCTVTQRDGATCLSHMRFLPWWRFTTSLRCSTITIPKLCYSHFLASHSS